jgi:hypothetical protein
MVRKLAVPVLQVNIAKKQVNVAGTCPPIENETKLQGQSAIASTERHPTPAGQPTTRPGAG